MKVSEGEGKFPHDNFDDLKMHLIHSYRVSSPHDGNSRCKYDKGFG